MFYTPTILANFILFFFKFDVMRLFSIVLCSFLSCFVSLCYSQTITTIAGTGTFGYTGDGGPATAAQFNNIQRITTDVFGNLYATTTHTIRKISPGGIVTTTAGYVGMGGGGFSGDGGLATAALLHTPFGITTDVLGNIYFAAVEHGRIRKIDVSGVINTIAGNGTFTYSGDGVSATLASMNAKDVAVDAAGNLYIADGINYRIRKINSTGIISTFAGNGTGGFYGEGILATAASIGNASSVHVDALGNVYFPDATNNRVRKVDITGVIRTIAGTGVYNTSGDGGVATAAEMRTPRSVAIDGNGNVYICELSGFRIRKINSAGIISTFAGNGVNGLSGDGGRATHAQTGARDISLYGDGVLYIVEAASIRMIKDDTVRFVGGAMQYINICGETNINSLLAVHDADTGQGLWWSIVSAPLHGTASVTYHDTATGGIVTPTGLTYIPASSYYGTDTFKVRVYDEMLSDTTTIIVSTYPNNAGAVAGADTVCVGNSTTLTNPIPGGVWSVSNANASVSATGIVSGIATGALVVSYSVSNPCVTTGVAHPMTVIPGDNCVSGLYTHSTSKEGMMVSPNPNNGDFSVLLSSAGRVTVTNSVGMLVATAKVQQSQPYSFHLSVPGLYVITGISASGQWHEKVVVR